jgi:hypothetical protein
VLRALTVGLLITCMTSGCANLQGASFAGYCLAHQLSWVIDFVCDALSGCTQDADTQPNKTMSINTFDCVSNQQVQDDWVNPELSADAFKQPTNQDHETEKRRPELKQESTARRSRRRALVRAGESAWRTAWMYGTPLYIWEKGRVVAKRP